MITTHPHIEVNKLSKQSFLLGLEKCAIVSNTSVHSLSRMIIKVMFLKFLVLNRIDDPRADIGNFSASAMWLYKSYEKKGIDMKLIIRVNKLLLFFQSYKKTSDF